MDVEEGLSFADELIYAKTGKSMNHLEREVFQGSWQNLTYEKIAEINRYSLEYIEKQVGPNLWEKLSEALGERVRKKSFKGQLEKAWKKPQTENAPPISKLSQPSDQYSEGEFPEGSVTLDSPFYIERLPIESHCYEAILQPGALIRIKAPRQMGKTSLLNRILAHANQENYPTVCLNLQEAEGEVFSNLDRFLRWFCSNVSLQLGISNQLDDYWNAEVIGSMVSCKTYFRGYLLQKIESALALGLDEVDRVFQYPDIANDFFPMLRSWHEEAKTVDIWKQLRLVVVHSTEDYGRLDINQSPFNIGLPIELNEFTPKQMEDLAQRHELNWNNTQVEQLMDMVGGHPYLVRLALYHLARQDATLAQLLQDAPTDAGIYNQHLRRHLKTLKECSELAAALRHVVTTTESVRLETMQGYRLYSMGLIKRQGNLVMPRCELYRLYFRDRLDNSLSYLQC
ncbi:MAG: AAA-like domain-containing protein [Xenococcaceae cyanobacterium]